MPHNIAAELKALQAISLVSSQKLASPVKTRRVQSLEPEEKKKHQEELAALQASYDEYVENSQMLEEELEREIAQTTSSLSKVTMENEELKEQLSSRQAEMTKLENDLASSTQRLTEQTRLRVSAELSQDDAENRARNLDGALEASRSECESLHEKLAYTEAELEEFRMTVDIEREENELQREDLESDLEKALHRAQRAEQRLADMVMLQHKTTMTTPQSVVRKKNDPTTHLIPPMVTPQSVLVTPMKNGYELSAVGSEVTDDRTTLDDSSSNSVYMEHSIAETESYDDLVSTQTPTDVVKSPASPTEKRVKRKRGLSSAVRKLGKKHFKGQTWFRRHNNAGASGASTSKKDSSFQSNKTEPTLVAE